MKDYHINCFYSAEDGGWIADLPDLAYCSAFGNTPQEAVTDVLVAKDAWLEAARAAGKPIPPPRYRPALYATVADRSPSSNRFADLDSVPRAPDAWPASAVRISR